MARPKAAVAVGIRDLKNRLPEYVRQVREGLEVIVTDRGRPVALLSRLDSAAGASLDTRLAALAARGDITLPSGTPIRRPRRVRAAGEPVSRLVLENRR